MPARPPEVADVFRKHGREYLDAYRPSPEQNRALRSIALCRTEALGGHKNVYSCGHEQVVCNSCEDRHCPKCQGSATRKWLDARANDLLPVRYFHVVFTLPSTLAAVALQNPREIYACLFRAAADALLVIGRDSKHLGAQLGFLAVLHTWGQNLHIHPHVHCVVPGGGISLDGSRWISARKRFLLPVRVLSRVFRRRFLELARQAQGRLTFHGKLAYLADPKSWETFLRSLLTNDWVVYSKPPFGGPQQVLKYLARYTHRVAISNARMVALRDGKLTFRWKDYAHGNQQKTMTLPPVEFIRRFLQHVLPHGFVRIRHYGFLSNSVRRAKLAMVRSLLAPRTPPPETSSTDEDSPGYIGHADARTPLCPTCGKGHLVASQSFPPVRLLPSRLSAVVASIDTS
jgi:hypothetical protein